MKLIEGVTFLTLAGGLHVAALALSDLPGGAQGGGDGGLAAFSMQAAPEHISDLVTHWDSPPDAAQAPDLPPPEVDTTPPSAPLPEQPAPVAKPAPRQIALPTLPENAPQIDTRLPAPRGLHSDAPRTPDSPPTPAMTELRAPSLDRPQTLALPQTPLPPAAPDLPQIDTVAATSPMAVATSRRPEPRPETLMPQPKPQPSATQPIAKPKAQPKPKAGSTARPAQRATGAGTGGTTASQSPKAQAGPGKAALQQAEAQWQAQINRAIGRAQRYPRGTSDSGRARVQITVSPKGRLQAARIVQSSGSAVLDRAALADVKRARIPRAAAALNKASYTYIVPMTYKR